VLDGSELVGSVVGACVGGFAFEPPHAATTRTATNRIAMTISHMAESSE
jgi:hypothetical protein